ncbi:MAG: MarR family transcriptional regulator [Bacteroidota bacterium]
MPLTPHLENSLGPYIGKASRVLEKRINRNLMRAGYDMTLHHWIIMVHLWKKDGQNQKKLCEYAGRNKTMITRIIDGLEKENYVLRVPDKQDRRNKLIYLTHKGKSMQEELGELMEGTLAEATEGVSAEDLATCKQVLHQVFLNLADEEILEEFAEN